MAVHELNLLTRMPLVRSGPSSGENHRVNKAYEKLFTGERRRGDANSVGRTRRNEAIEVVPHVQFEVFLTDVQFKSELVPYTGS